MNPVTLVVPSRFSKIFYKFRDNVDKFLPGISKILVRDGTEIAPPGGTDFEGRTSLWTTVQGPDGVFSWSRNVNLGWQHVPLDNDILLSNDDALFTQSDAVRFLQEDAYSDPTIGIISPKVLGQVGNDLQSNPNSEGITYSENGLCFVCVFIKREVIEKIGCMDDEVFVGSYGMDDIDYCHRAKLAGYKLAVTPRVQVKHPKASESYSHISGITWDAPQKFTKKWGF
jgi:hypothetical protein